MKDIENVRKKFPDVFILTHPECSPELIEKVDYSGSTNAMIKPMEETKARHFYY